MALFAILQWLRNVIDWFRIPFASSRTVLRLMKTSPSDRVRIRAAFHLMKRARYYAEQLAQMNDDN